MRPVKIYSISFWFLIFKRQPTIFNHLNTSKAPREFGTTVFSNELCLIFARYMPYPYSPWKL